jgi:hypothetical protein
VVSFTPRPLNPQGKSPSYSLDERLGGPQSRSGRGGEEKNSQPLPGLEPPIIQPVVQRCTTEIFPGAVFFFSPPRPDGVQYIILWLLSIRMRTTFLGAVLTRRFALLVTGSVDSLLHPACTVRNRKCSLYSPMQTG